MEKIHIKKKRKRLTLKPVYEGLRVGIKSDGRKYSVRDDRRRYFFPDEWESFIKQFKNKEHKFFFLTLLHTGGRIMEVLNLKYENINIERETVNFKIVNKGKQKRIFMLLESQEDFLLQIILSKNINPLLEQKK